MSDDSISIEMDSEKENDLLEGTQVDLGDDLLEPTEERSLLESRGPESAFQNAEILFREGFTEEAKKELYRILRETPKDPSARKLLDEIQQFELNRIFQSHEKPEEKTSRFPMRSILKELDRELQLGIFERSHPASLEASFFEDSVQIQSYLENLEKELKNASLKDRMDLGIAFFEMGLYEIAAHQFRKVSELSIRGAEYDLSVSALGLQALSLIEGGRPFDAILMVEGALADPDLRESDRIDFLYLMARAHEELEKWEAAGEWYHQVLENDPSYRDAKQRLDEMRSITRS